MRLRMPGLAPRPEVGELAMLLPLLCGRGRLADPEASALHARRGKKEISKIEKNCCFVSQLLQRLLILLSRVWNGRAYLSLVNPPNINQRTASL